MPSALRIIALIAAFASAVSPLCRGQQAQPKQATPAVSRVHILYFGADGGVSAGQGDVHFTCVVRNDGALPLPEGAAHVRCFTISGLDYTSGDMRPALPEMRAGEAVAIHWRLAPTDTVTPLAAGVVLLPNNVEAASATQRADSQPATQQANVGPDYAVAVVPRVARLESLDMPATLHPGAPWARTAEGIGAVGNDRVRVEAVLSRTGSPILIESSRAVPTGPWIDTAVIFPVLLVRSAVPGARSWDKDFRCTGLHAEMPTEAGTLKLEGAVGDGWTALVTLTAQKDTCAIAGSVRVTARWSEHVSSMELFGVSVPEHTPVPGEIGVPVEVNLKPPAFGADACVDATNVDGITTGFAWPGESPLPQWQWQRRELDGADGESHLAVRWTPPGPSADVAAGATLSLNFRLFALVGSTDVHDALRFAH